MPIGPIRRLSILLSLAILPIAAACSDSPPAPSATRPTQQAAPQQTVTWSFWGDPWELAVNQRVVRAFEREHPTIRVRIEHHPWGEYFPWLRGEWQAGRSPDVMFLNYIPTYVAMGELEPLDGYVTRDSASLDDFYPALLDAFRWEGTLYGLPRDNDTKVIYYNRAHFAEAGIPEPKDGWTWADLRAAALALTRHDSDEISMSRYGFGFETSYWWLPWVWQNGGQVLDSSTHPTDVLLDSPKNAEALQFLQDLIHSDRVTPPPDQLNTDDMNQLFREGRLSMVFGNHALVPWFTEAPGLLWDVAPLPRNVERVNLAGGAGFVISRRSQQKEAAWTLLRFLSGPKSQSILAESGVITPARRSVREDNIFLRQQRYNAGVFVAETEIGRPVPNFPGVTEMERVIDAGLRPLWRGERPAADVLRDLAPQVAAAIGVEGY
jgi:multiple sugar transport system substrate-binding protein